jgi:hypothetical protein
MVKLCWTKTEDMYILVYDTLGYYAPTKLGV